MNWKEFGAKLRPTAIVFGVIMAVLAWLLIDRVLGGPLGEVAFGEAGQAVAVFSATLIVIGVAVGTLGNAMLELSKDGPAPQVPESAMLAVIDALKAERVALPTQLILAEEVENNRAREGLEEAG